MDRGTESLEIAMSLKEVVDITYLDLTASSPNYNCRPRLNQRKIMPDLCPFCAYRLPALV